MASSYNSQNSKFLYHATQVVWFCFGIVEALLALRFILKLLGADPTAAFSNFIYGTSHIFAAPFLSVFSVTEVQGTVFEWTTVLAIFVYWMLAIGIIKLILMGRSVSTQEAAVGLDNQE